VVVSTIDFIGGWGGRASSYDEIVAAARRMLTSMPTEPSGRWVRFIERPGSQLMDAVPVDVDDLESLGAAVELISRRGDRHELRISRQVGPDDVPISVRVKAGSEHSDNRIVISVELSEGDAATLISEYMSAMISAWDPDWLKAGTYQFHVAQKGIGLQPKETALGWRTYLSDRVSFDAAVAVEAGVMVTAVDGGRYVTLAGAPDDPDLDQAAVVRRALGYG
jgi:hypothetical protein